MPHRLPPFLLVTLALLAAPLARAADDANGPPKVRIALVGDSTVTPTAGWGDGFAARLTDRAEVINLSAGGRSSMSFIKEGRWAKCLELKPDYVLIQFGHNDQKLDDPARGTKPGEGYRRYMNQYIDEARAAGIKPVLVTSLARREWKADGKIHSSLIPYVDVAKSIAEAKHVPLIDLHARSIEFYEAHGKAEVNELSPRKPATAPSATRPADTIPTVIDNTHLNPRGSAAIGNLVADELAKAVPELSPYVRPAPPTPAPTR